MTTSDESSEPEEFAMAVAAMRATRTRREIDLSPIRPPQRLAPYSFALGAEVLPQGDPAAPVPEDGPGEAFGRLILLYDPNGQQAWAGTMRLVTYFQCEIEPELADDPMLPEVAWSWLVEGLDERGAEYTALGGTVTATRSVRYGDIIGPERAHQLELRASWTPLEPELAEHVDAFCTVLSFAAGLPPEGVQSLQRR